MEEDAYRSTYHQINTIRCAFEKTILNRHGNCALAHKFCLAEREGVSCQSAVNQQRCQHFLQLVRSRAQFVLKLTQTGDQLPHAKELRVQLGGLQGLAKASNFPLDGKNVNDINKLISQAESCFTTLEDVPADNMIRAIKNIPGRRARKKRPRET